MGWWVSLSPKQAAKHIFNTHMHDEHIGNSASHVKLFNQEYSNEFHSLAIDYSTPQSLHLVLGRYNELRSLHCHTTQGSGVDGQNTQVTELPRNLNLKQKSNQPRTHEYTTTHRCLHNK